VGGGESDFVSYGLIPQITNFTSSFASSGVTVPIYGNALVGVLLNPDNAKPPGFLHVPASGSNSFKRWFAVSNNGMGQVLDDRTALAARGDLPILQTDTFKVS